jgi:hypothetical protein
MAAVEHLVDALRSDLANAAQALVSGRHSTAQWQRAMLQTIADHQTAAYLAGAAERLGAREGTALLRRGNLSRAERTDIQKATQQQAAYLHGFAEAVDQGDLSPAQIQARAAAYAGSVKATYWEARTGARLPFYPGDGCQCGNNCHCMWQQRQGAWWWMLGGAVEHCDDCRRRADGSPYEASE